MSCRNSSKSKQQGKLRPTKETENKIKSTETHIKSPTHPAFSSADPRRLFLRWLAVTANGAAGRNPAPVSCSIPTQTEWERLSWNRFVGVPVVGVIPPLSASTDDVSDPDSRDSRLNRPITDLAALGFVNPPTRGSDGIQRARGWWWCSNGMGEFRKI